MTILLPDKGSPIDAFVNQIFHADALELLAALPDASVDMVLADLPYGVTACAWDSIIPIEPMWEGLKRVIKRRGAIVLTATQPFTSRLVSSNYAMFRYEWVWDRNVATNPLGVSYMPMRRHENILVFGKESPNYHPVRRVKPNEWLRKASHREFINHKGDAYGANLKTIAGQQAREWSYPISIIEIQAIHPSTRTEDRTYHPTEKPVALFEYLIRTYTQPGEIVLDMTCGSGTTAVAAAKSDRRYICGDNGYDDRTGRSWADIARERVQNSDPYQDTLYKDGSKQLSLFHANET